jgi:hypothetical protein
MKIARSLATLLALAATASAIAQEVSAAAFSTKEINCVPKPLPMPASSPWIGSDYSVKSTLACTCIRWTCVNSATIETRNITLCGLTATAATSSAKADTIRKNKEPISSLQTLDKRILVESLSDPKFAECPK